MKVLMIAYEFPPSAAGGVLRTVKLAKDLARLGIRPHVLTTRIGRSGTSDASLLNELGTDVVVHRTAGLEYQPVLAALHGALARSCGADSRIPDAVDWRIRRLLQALDVPDALSCWAVPAAVKGWWLCARHRIDALYSTSWPFSDHLAGLLLHRITGLPWIADFRDPWLQHYNYGPRGTGRDRTVRRLEASVCREAAFVVNVTASATRALRRLHPELPGEKFVTVRNGFDPDDFGDCLAPADDFLIVHAGSFYGTRNPDGFFAGLQRFANARPDAVPQLRLMCLGTALDRPFAAPAGRDAAPDINQCSALHQRIEYLPWINHRESVNWMQRARVLLLIQHRDPRIRLTVPGKLYEYFATGNHILGLNIAPNEVSALLRGYGNATILHDSAPSAVADALARLYEMFATGALERQRARGAPHRRAFVERFDRRRSAGRLADLLHRATTVPRHTPRGATVAPLAPAARPLGSGARMPARIPEGILCAC